jgi:hypothetical protein
VAGAATEIWSSAMMGLTDRLEPWARRFQRTAAGAPSTEADTDPLAELARATRHATGDGEDTPPARRTGRFTRRVLHEHQR